MFTRSELEIKTTAELREQAALIRITLERKAMSYPDRYDQESLLNLHKAKMHLEMAIGLLNQ
jgi:hypothetical protein